jgi:arginine deiminase
VIHLELPKARRYMHPDTIYNRITEHLALVHLPAIQAACLYREDIVESIDFAASTQARGVELVNVSDAEQRRLACSFVPLELGVLFHYDTALDLQTRRVLSRKGVEFIVFHPGAMRAGGGSLRCLTLRLHRTDVRSPWEQ